MTLVIIQIVKSRLKIHDMRRCSSHPRVKLKFKKQNRKFEKEEKNAGLIIGNACFDH